MRTLTPETIDALNSGQVKFIVLVSIITPSISLRMTSDTSNTVFLTDGGWDDTLTWDDAKIWDDYEGAELYVTGSLGNISDVSESKPDDTGIAITFSGVDVPTLAAAAMPDFINSPVKVYLLVSGGGSSGSILLFDGVTNNAPSISYGNKTEIAVSCQGKFAALNRTRSERYADAEQQRKYPGDLGMQYASTVASREVIWPAASFFD